MTQEDKELLVQDLCARLSYGVKVKVLHEDILHYDSEEGVIIGKESRNDDCFVVQCNYDSYILSYDEFKLYLLPKSSMTDKQKAEYHWLQDGVPAYHYEHGDIVDDVELHDNWQSIDYLTANHFDYRGLIEYGLAIDATGLGIY